MAVSVTGLDIGEKCDYNLKALAAVEHMGKKGHPGALSLESGCRSRLISYNRSEKEVSAMAAGMIAMANLTTTDVHPNDMEGLNKSKMWVALLLFGNFKSTYSVKIQLAQLKEGARVGLDGYTFRIGKKVLDSLPLGSFERLRLLDASTFPFSCHTIYFIELPTIKQYITSECGELDVRAREIYEMYHL
jgi:hypothetical protein